MRATASRELDGLEHNLEFLANVGSISPYVGLFGTVWGIMISFQGLANVKEATIATVAPGISEALIATAMGLFAAIPAVWAYNRFATKVERIAVRYDAFAEEFSSILQRQAHLDESDPHAPVTRWRVDTDHARRIAMAMTATGRRIRKRKLKAEINVVPYIDVMLVLLIIFMVTAPLLNLGVDIELPQSNAQADRAEEGAGRGQRRSRRQLLPDPAGRRRTRRSTREQTGRRRSAPSCATTRTCRCSSPATATANHEASTTRWCCCRRAPTCRKVGLMSQPAETRKQ